LSRRRSKLKIYLDVLYIIKSGTGKPTRIMYESNLSWEHLQRIITSMVEQSLIEEIDTTLERRRDKRSSKRYELTQKGENVYRYFNNTKAFGIDDVKIAW